MKQAFKRHRKAIESLYKGKCTIYEYKEYRDPETEELKSNLVPVYENIPCKLCKKTINPGNKTEVANIINYVSVLHVNPDIKIKAGSKIVVTQHGITREFERSGEPPVYETHQEVPLQRVGKE